MAYAFYSKFSGAKCKFCGGRIQIDERISWNRKQKGLPPWHWACDPNNHPDGEPTLRNGRNFDTKYEKWDNTPVMAPTPVVEMPEIKLEVEEDDPFGFNETPTPKPTPAPANNTNIGEQLAQAIAPYLDSRLKAHTTKQQVEEIVKSILDSKILKTVATVELVSEQDGKIEIKDMGVQHRQFSLLLQTLQARQSSGHRLNVWLTGPAGTGKTTAAKACAEALGLPFFFIGSIDTEYKLNGFVDAQGRLVSTPFRDAYQNGGVFLFDECDSSLPAALLAFNAALANGEAAFPDGIVERHRDFVCIAAANTWGLGATHEYVGRLKLDAAFLDRFVQIHWDIDEHLEYATAGNVNWVNRVQSIRKAVRTKGLKVIVSPRASYFGAALLATGMTQEVVEQITIKKAMTDEQWASVKGGM